ncbi:cytochrome P450 302a1, mitochondrial isoform X2 [Homalodisca vitripennis]|uniref:cytochrome P450 302a1, mitochondrial isoform X1 n=1 Tax=Homalodisca vitripennis TaxID=197043 RepID=UPI001EE9D20F|nr:cytochrome P450 302a1, mitochondrial isoform X1 [Homalodisca vitripennis]XP_046665558.1 cytochrome P450 302a1, mitochondrial isoform X1 [Homalodisca vitripennis]XP_046665559.1 cytochrome P450 302a1, mitochondrial isoform X1 [Homalodisca vitripennis]XP_046665560.1 cytochrome P450 302a1, mitochondrial isoform X2 [Homalodisca vitripennis]
MEILRKLSKHASVHGQLSARFLSCPVRPSDKEVKINFNATPSEVKPFDSIPGPKSFPVIGTLYKYLPVIGEYQFDRLHKNGLKKLLKYGPLVREDIIPGVKVVWVFSPDDIKKVYASEGRYPSRRTHLALKKYREDRPHIYNNGGVLLSDGEEWWRMRSVFQRNLSKLQDVRLHLPVTDTIMEEFIQFVTKSPDITDLVPKLSRLYLELTCMIAFSTRLQCFSEAEQDPNSITSQLMQAAFSVTSCVLKTDNGLQLWRYWRTPMYRKLEKSVKIIEKKAIELVGKLKPGENVSLVSQYLTFPELHIKDIHAMSVDIILAGVDTTTYTSCFALYYLATNPEKQEKLHQEAHQLLPSSQDIVTADVIEKALYAHSVVKETLRLSPVSVGIGRVLPKDVVLSGYDVPAGTVVVTQNQVICRLEEFFPQPNEFVPERWLRNTPTYVRANPYLVLPFGHGPRACIARRLSEQNLQVLLLKLIRDYKVTWHGGENLGVRSLLINKPDQPVLIGMTRRHSSSS